MYSLVVDETRVREKLIYNKQRDAFVGDVDMGPELQHISPRSEDEILANSLLCFLLCGLHARFKIPVGYFFTKGCTGEQLAVVVSHVLRKTTDVGFDIVRLVTDNHKVNVATMDILCGGKASIQASHPADPSEQIFLSFDQSHIIKNVRLQFLAKDFGKEKQIPSRYVKSLYKMQKNSTVRPVRFLTRKRVYPKNIEKMNVRAAVQLFSLAVTTALSYLKDQGGHSCDADFASAGPANDAEVVYDDGHYDDCQQHIHCNNVDARQFTEADDPRLEWLEGAFLTYIEDLRNESAADS